MSASVLKDIVLLVHFQDFNCEIYVFMSFCRILSTLCSQVVFHNIPHFGKRAGQKVQRKCFFNQTDHQGAQTEGFEMEGLEMER
jgi:hypothetical protein